MLKAELTENSLLTQSLMLLLLLLACVYYTHTPSRYAAQP
jgi:hypothetical protein